MTMKQFLRASLASVAPMFLLFAVQNEAGELAPGLYARIETNKGTIVCQLYYKDTPLTVANFVGLAEGTIGPKRGQPYYDGIVFHRVIPNFMIQGGDPTGTGTGGPGYKFGDEIRPNLKHNSPGILSMANAGPGTNGSQFFITHVPTPHLDGKHTVFGKVVSGQNVVNAIKQGDVMSKVTIVRVGPDAESYRVDQATFDRLKAGDTKAVAAASPAPAAAKTPAASNSAGSGEDYGKIIRRYEKEAKTSMTGLKYVVLKEGSGNKPRPGQTIDAEYTGRFMDGRSFDSSVGRGPFSFKVGKGEVIAGWDEALGEMKVGEKRALIVPSKLAYGKKGMGGVIPPDATLYFEVERLK